MHMLIKCWRGLQPPHIYSEKTYGGTKPVWARTIPPGCICVQMIRQESFDGMEYRHRIFYPGERLDYTIEHVFDEPLTPPWIVIGGQDEYGTTVYFTKELFPYTVRGNTIKLSLLQALYPHISGWKYMDATFEEIEFPVDGITI